MTPVTLEIENNIAVVTLNQPHKRNSMNPELLDSFQDRIEEVLKNASVRCVIITGNGSCFSAGANLSGDLQRGGEKMSGTEKSFAMYQPFLRVLDIPVPVIGALNGHAVGGGFGLALICDIRVVNRDAKYGANFARLGIHSGMAISYLLPRLVGVSKASELLFTGKLVLGEEAAAIGLASRAVGENEVKTSAQELAQDIALSAPLAVRSMKAALRDTLSWAPRDWAHREAEIQAESLLTEDAKEGVAALLEKRVPKFSGK